MNRVGKVSSALAEHGIDALLVSQPENRRYISGFDGSAGYAIVSDYSAILATDFRYTAQAKMQARDFHIEEIKGEIQQWLPELLSERHVSKLGFEAQDLPYTTWEAVQSALAKLPTQLIPTRGIVEELRAVKDKDEIEQIEKAVALADETMAFVAKMLRPGHREREIAWEAEKFLREKRSQSLPFEVIVASGLNSALPHAQSSERPLGSGVPIVVDLGARIEGYCSDLTRTLFFGEADSIFKAIYSIVAEAQQAAIAGLREGMTGGAVDKLARDVIEKAGYGSSFGHGLGHGIGLAVHEMPRLGPGSPHVLKEGMVFTIEPGIYLPNWGGVRIEDVVTIERKGKIRILSQAEKLSFAKEVRVHR